MRGTQLRGGEVRACSVICERVNDADFAILWRTLSFDERARADRFRFALDRTVYVVAHALLRTMLGECIAGPVAFSHNDWGKPAIDRPGNRVRFNLTHTHAFAACALTLDDDIGIDAEARDPSVDVLGVAEHAFAPHERAQLAAAHEADRQDVFLRLWTLKEAFVKAVGRGLSIPLTDFAFTLEPLSFHCSPGLDVVVEDWVFRSFALGQAHWVTVARSSSARAGLDLSHRVLTPVQLAATASALP
jgi:4'-phosphopantetheinyl transferase